MTAHLAVYKESRRWARWTWHIYGRWLVGICACICIHTAHDRVSLACRRGSDTSGTFGVADVRNYLLHMRLHPRDLELHLGEKASGQALNSKVGSAARISNPSKWTLNQIWATKLAELVSEDSGKRRGF